MALSSSIRRLLFSFTPLLFLLIAIMVYATQATADEGDRVRQGTVKEDTRTASLTLNTQDLTTGVTLDDLANMIVGSGVMVSNITYTGSYTAAGTFNGTPGIAGFDEGIILSSGDMNDVVGPNQSNSTTTEQLTPGDADLSLLSGFPTFDAAILEFDFVPNDSQVFFQFTFASEEYNEFVDFDYNDVFAFFINGQNCAEVRGDPVTINTISLSSNTELFRNNDLVSGSNIDTEADGLTLVLTCNASVTANATNHMKLAIADASDRLYDSWVFIKKGSLTTDISINLGPNPGTPCVNTNHVLVATIADSPQENISVSFEIISGPHAGLTGTALTDISGQANFSYTSTGTGVDVAQASFVASDGQTYTSEDVQVIWESCITPTATPTIIPTTTETPMPTTPTPTPEVTVTPTPTSEPPPFCSEPSIFGIDDQLRSDSQFFNLDLGSGDVAPLGPLHMDSDFEAMDIHPDTGVMYAIGGGDGSQSGKVFEVNKEDGSLTLLGDTGIRGAKEVVSAAFHPDGTLWVFQQNIGLLTIDITDTFSTTLMWEANLADSGKNWEGLAWDRWGSKLYGTDGRKLYEWDPETETAVQLCGKNFLPGATEALDFRDDGALLGGWHNASSNELSVFVIDYADCTITAANYDIMYRDVESLASNVCIPDGSISGSVITINGRPLANVEVQLIAASNNRVLDSLQKGRPSQDLNSTSQNDDIIVSQFTDEEGRYHFAGLPSDIYAVALVANGEISVVQDMPYIIELKPGQQFHKEAPTAVAVQKATISPFAPNLSTVYFALISVSSLWFVGKRFRKPPFF